MLKKFPIANGGCVCGCGACGGSPKFNLMDGSLAKGVAVLRLVLLDLLLTLPLPLPGVPPAGNGTCCPPFPVPTTFTPSGN